MDKKIFNSKMGVIESTIGWLNAPIGRLVIGFFYSVTLVSTAVALWAGVLQLQDFNSEQAARNWQLVTTPASGNSGKVEALQWLFNNGTELVDLDLSCERMSGVDKKGVCKSLTYLNRLSLHSNNVGIEKRLFSANMSGVDLRNCELAGLNFQSSISKAQISNCRFFKDDLIFNGKKFRIDQSSFEDSDLNFEGQGKLSKIKIFKTRISLKYSTSILFTEASFNGSNIYISGSSFAARGPSFVERSSGRFQFNIEPSKLIINNSNLSGLTIHVHSLISEERFVLERAAAKARLLKRDQSQPGLDDLVLNSSIGEFNSNFFWSGEEPKIYSSMYTTRDTDPASETFLEKDLYVCDPGNQGKNKINFEKGKVGVALLNDSGDTGVHLHKNNEAVNVFIPCYTFKYKK